MIAVSTDTFGLVAVLQPQFVAVLLQAGPDVSIRSSLLSVVGSAVGAFLTTLLFGAIMLALAPDYTQRRMSDVVERPLGTFGYGIVSLVFTVLVTVVLVITIIGILVAIPFAILSYVVWAIGSAIAFLAIADRLVGHDEGWVKSLLIGAGINALLTVTGIGALLSFCIGAAGFGAVLQEYLN